MHGVPGAVRAVAFPPAWQRPASWCWCRRRHLRAAARASSRSLHSCHGWTRSLMCKAAPGASSSAAVGADATTYTVTKDDELFTFDLFQIDLLQNGCYTSTVTCRPAAVGEGGSVMKSVRSYNSSTCECSLLRTNGTENQQDKNKNITNTPPFPSYYGTLPLSRPDPRCGARPRAV